jgi:predicted dehydrogenase
MSKQNLRLAIIGTGNISNSHLRKFALDPNVDIVACCDLNLKAAKDYAKRHNIPAVYDDMQAMFDGEQLDGVSVCVPDGAHAAVSIAALKSGLHVLSEKPMATTLADARAMVKAAKKAKRVGMINFSYRETPGLDEVKKIIDDGLLGDLRHVEARYFQSWLNGVTWGGWKSRPAFLWRMSQDHRGGTLGDIGCHIIDLTNYLVGDVASLSCMMKSFHKGVRNNTYKGYTLDADDTFIANVEFAQGAFGMIRATRWATGFSNDLAVDVFGTKGSLRLETNGGTGKLKVCIGDLQVARSLWTDVPLPPDAYTVQQRFADSIRDGKAKSPSFEDGVRNQAIMDACVKSAAKNGMVAVKV